MAIYIGAVRFADGSLMWFQFHGDTDECAPALFASSQAARSALAARPESGEVDQQDAETVEVMPYHEHGNKSVSFASYASRSLMRITGPLSLSEAASSPPHRLFLRN